MGWLQFCMAKVQHYQNCYNMYLTECLRIAALNHEILDDTVEERAVVIALACQLDEVVPVLGCLVVEAHDDVAHCGMYLDLR